MRFFKIKLFTFFLIVAISSAKDKSDSVSIDTYNIYKIVIDSLFSSYNIDTTEHISNKKPLQLVICDSTVSAVGNVLGIRSINDYFKLYRKKGINLKYDFVLDFPTKNKKNISLYKKKFQLELPINLINRIYFMELSQDTDKDFNIITPNYYNFYLKYPNSSGFINLSQVGFSKNRNTAMLYADRWCHGMCGDGHWIILKKKKDKWIIKKIFFLWQS